MDWASIETTVDSLVTNLSGVNVQWAYAPRDFRAPGALGAGVVGFLQAGGVRSIGQGDEIIYAYDGGTDSLGATVVGRREMTITVRFESRLATLGNSARATAELVRTKLWRPGSLSALREGAGIALNTIGPAVDISYPDGNRMVDAWAFDLFLSVPSIVAPEAADDYIETVEISATMEDEGGDTLPEPPNFTNKVFP